MKYIPLFLLMMLILAACGQASEDPPAPVVEQEAAPAQQYEAVGVVVGFIAEKKFVNIRHETIPGFMNAMTMPFEVKDSTLLRGIHEGDSIAFRFTVAGGIQAIEKRE